MEKKRFSWDDNEALSAAIKAIGEGEIGIGDTDTVPGLFAACTADGVTQLNAIKGRSDKPYLVLVGSRDALFSFIKQPISLQVEKLMKECWPGPLTLVLPAQEDVPVYLQSKAGGIAIRIPEHPRVRELALRCGGVLSTSANFAGMPTPPSLNDLDPLLAQKASFILYDSNHVVGRKPSTILDATMPHLRLLREGALSVDDLEILVGATILR